MMHAELLKLLLPPSSIDPNGPAISIELSAEGKALDDAYYSADQLLEEADPNTTALMLSDWERVYGLPDACVAAAGIVQSIQERRAALVAKESFVGGQSPAFFIGLAADLGYTITITEYSPHTTEHDSEHPITDDPWRFVWQVNAPLNTLRDRTSEDDTEMATAVWGNALMECVISRFKPAHTHVIFAYE